MTRIERARRDDASRAYRPAPGPRQGGWTTLALVGVLGLGLLGVGGWLASPNGLATPAGAEHPSTAWPEAPPELRIERRALRFDHMFRAERSVPTSRGAVALGT